MKAEDVAEIMGSLETVGITVWLDGGWGVDALLAHQTRPHGDLDLLASLDDMQRLQQALSLLGYCLIRGNASMSFKMTDAAGREIDVHSVAFTRSGAGLFRMDNGGEWLCSAEGFDGVGQVSGSQVRCLTPEAKVQRVCRSGYELDPTHLNDIAALRERATSRQVVYDAERAILA